MMPDTSKKLQEILESLSEKVKVAAEFGLFKSVHSSELQTTIKIYQEFIHSFREALQKEDSEKLLELKNKMLNEQKNIEKAMLTLKNNLEEYLSLQAILEKSQEILACLYWFYFKEKEHNEILQPQFSNEEEYEFHRPEFIYQPTRTRHSDDSEE